MSVHHHPRIGYPYARPVPPPDAATIAAPFNAPFRPGPHYPPAGWRPGPYPPPAPRRGGRTWAVAGASAAAVLAVIGTGVALAATNDSHPSAGRSASTSTTTTPAATSTQPTPTTTPTAPVVPVDALPGMLADPAAVAAAVGSPGMTVVPDSHPDVMWTANVDNPDCLGVYHPAEQAVYQGSRWVAVQGQSLREPGATSRHTVIQAVVSFPTARAATDFATQQRGSWTRCIGKSITATYPKNGPETFSVSAVTTGGGVLKAVLTEEGANGWGCQRALTTRSNVVVDVAACGFAPGDQAATIATEITGHGT